MTVSLPKIVTTFKVVVVSAVISYIGIFIIEVVSKYAMLQPGQTFYVDDLTIQSMLFSSFNFIATGIVCLIAGIAMQIIFGSQQPQEQSLSTDYYGRIY